MSKTNLGYRLFSKAVHNEAMKTDPPEIYGWRALVLAMSVCTILTLNVLTAI